MKTLKVDDVVSVYGQTPYGFSHGARAQIKYIDEDGDAIAEYGNGESGLVHPKQCRLLRKKEDRGERWLIRSFEEAHSIRSAYAFLTREDAVANSKDGDQIHRLVEIFDDEAIVNTKNLPLPNEILLNKEKLKQAVEAIKNIAGSVDKISDCLWGFLQK